MGSQWFRVGWGRNWLRQVGHRFDFAFIVRPDLTPEGHAILSAIRFHAETQPFRMWIGSDAKEIAERNLAVAQITR